MPLDYSDYPKIEWFPPIFNYKLDNIIGKRILIKLYYTKENNELLEIGITEARLLEVSKSENYFHIAKNGLFGEQKYWISKDEFVKIFVDIVDE